MFISISAVGLRRRLISQRAWWIDIGESLKLSVSAQSRPSAVFRQLRELEWGISLY